MTTATAATAANWSDGNKFKDADGTEWTIAATTDETAHTVKAADIANYLKDGCTIVSNANTKLVGTSVVDDLGKNPKDYVPEHGLKGELFQFQVSA